MNDGRAWHAVVLTCEVVVVFSVALLALTLLTMAVAVASGRMSWRQCWELWWFTVREELRRKR